MNKKETREQIACLAKRPALTKKEKTLFWRLINENEECAKAVFWQLFRSSHVNNVKISEVFYAAGKGAELAQAQADYWWKNHKWHSSATPKEIRHFTRWIVGRSDIKPEHMPKSGYIMFYQRPFNSNLCYMSKVHCLPERLFIYGARMGYVDIARDPVKLMISLLGLDYARSYLDRIESYPQSKEDVESIMQMYSMICAGPHKVKNEETLYFERIQRWLLEDEDIYWNAISRLSEENQRKIKKRLT